MTFLSYGGVTAGNDAVMLVSQGCWEDSAAEFVHLSLRAATRCAEHHRSFENARLSRSSSEGTSPYLQEIILHYRMCLLVGMSSTFT